MNPKEKTLFEGIVIVVLVVVLFGWLTFRSFTSGGVTSIGSSLPAIPTAALTDATLDQLAQDLTKPELFYQVPVAEPSPGDKDKGTLVQ